MTVHVPRAAAAELLRLTVIGLTEVARLNGERPPVSRGVLDVLHELHRATVVDESACGPETVGVATMDESGSGSRARVTVAAAAARLGCSPRHVRRLIRAGRLGATKHGRDWIIELKDDGAPNA